MLNPISATAPFFSDGDGEEVPWLQLEIRNDGEVPHRAVWTESRFHDADEAVMDTWEAFTDLLPAETTWRTYVRQEFDMDDLDEANSTVTQHETGTRGTIRDDAEVLNSSMSTDEMAVTVTVEVEIEPHQTDLTQIHTTCWYSMDRSE